MMTTDAAIDVRVEAEAAMLRRLRNPETPEGRLALARALELRALAGEGVSRSKLEKAARKRWRHMDTARRVVLVDMALEDLPMPAEPEVRRLDPSIIPPRRVSKETMMSDDLTEAQETRVREAVTEAFRLDPRAKPGPVLEQLQREGIDLAYPRFTHRYWYRIRDELGIPSPRMRAKAAKPKETKPKAAAKAKVVAKPKVTPHSEQTAAAEPAEAKTPEASTRPIRVEPATMAPRLRCEPTSDGDQYDVSFVGLLKAPLAFAVVRAIAAAIEEYGGVHL